MKIIINRYFKTDTEDDNITLSSMVIQTDGP